MCFQPIFCDEWRTIGSINSVMIVGCATGRAITSRRRQRPSPRLYFQVLLFPILPLLDCTLQVHGLFLSGGPRQHVIARLTPCQSRTQKFPKSLHVEESCSRGQWIATHVFPTNQDAIDACAATLRVCRRRLWLYDATVTVPVSRHSGKCHDSPFPATSLPLGRNMPWRGSQDVSYRQPQPILTWPCTPRCSTGRGLLPILYSTLLGIAIRAIGSCYSGKTTSDDSLSGLARAAGRRLAGRRRSFTVAG